jgi:hypothetical protein
MGDRFRIEQARGQLVGLSWAGGGAGISGATRWCSAGGSPMWRSSPSGRATSSANAWPQVAPVTRLITSPTSQP